jgi:LacI family transcriptional regulator
MVKRRKHGYLEALRENRIPIDRDLVACEKIDYQWALESTTRLLRQENRPDAILAFNDIITFAAFTAIKQQGLSIPEDVALIGFTDDLHAQYVTPQMSAIEDQAHKMGSVAYELLQKSIGGDFNIYKKTVPQKIIIRGTSDKHEKV